jgi:DNA-binding GntR family transcriptional regulator
MATARFDRARRREGETFASATYAQLRRDIIEGKFPAGGKLRIRQLCAHYEVGISPIREALNRLSRDGFVLQSDLQGFAVAPLNIAELDELTKTRCWLNETALSQSIKNGDAQWEEQIVLAFHRLSRVSRWVDPDDLANVLVNPDWEIAHRQFHSSLIAASGSRLLQQYCEQLFDIADRYRHVSRTPSAKRTRGRDEHRLIMEATIARDTGLAVKLLSEHFQRTADLGRQALAAKR